MVCAVWIFVMFRHSHSAISYGIFTYFRVEYLSGLTRNVGSYLVHGIYCRTIFTELLRYLWANSLRFWSDQFKVVSPSSGVPKFVSKLLKFYVFTNSISIVWPKFVSKRVFKKSSKKSHPKRWAIKVLIPQNGKPPKVRKKFPKQISRVGHIQRRLGWGNKPYRWHFTLAGLRQVDIRVILTRGSEGISIWVLQWKHSTDIEIGVVSKMISFRIYGVVIACRLTSERVLFCKVLQKNTRLPASVCSFICRAID